MTGSLNQLAKLYTQNSISENVMKMFDKDEDGNLVQEQSMFDHQNGGKIPCCPICLKGSKNYHGTVRNFAKVSEDRVEGELIGTHYKCNMCGTRLLVIND